MTGAVGIRRARGLMSMSLGLVLALVAGAALVALPAAPAAAVIQDAFYVSPDGDDDSPGTLAEPFATIERAREEVADHNTDMSGDIIVYLRGGVHALTAGLEFTESDSASNGHRIVYKAYADEAPVISGGIEVDGWTEVDAVNNIYRAPVPAGFDTRQLYVDGVRAVRARSPRTPSGFAMTATGFSFNVPTSSPYATLASWGNTSDIQFTFQGRPWQFHYCGVDTITSAPNPSDPTKVQGAVTMDAVCWNNAQWHVGMLWFENARELLDAPREWYLDRAADYLYYKPGEGEDLTSATVTAAKLESLVSIAGADAAHPVRGLAFEGITFAYATWLRPNSTLGYADLQGGTFYDPTTPSKFLAGAVALRYADGIDITDSTMTNIGGLAVSVRDSDDVEMVGNRFADLSHNAININGTDGFDISNNYFTRMGTEFLDGMPINIWDATGTVDHNEISNVTYSGIGRYGTGAVKIRYNYVHDYMMRLGDGGAIYTNTTNPTNDDPATPSINEGDEIAWNYAYQQNAAYGAIYFDDGSGEEYAHHNVLNQVPYGFLIKGGGHRVSDNYQSTGSLITSCSGCTFGDNPVVSDGNWPQAARDIMTGAGLESPYLGLRDEDDLLRVPRSEMSATATSQYDAGHAAAKALDDSLLTMWHSSAAAPQSITLSLGDIYRVSGVEVTPRQDMSTNGVITQYKVYTSVDGVTFTQAGAGTWSDDLLKKTARITTPTDAGFVKIEAVAGLGGFASAAAIDVVYEPDEDLVGHWELNETAGATAADASGAHNDASLSGGGSWVPGVVRNGRLFNGVDSVAQVLDDSAGAAYSVSMWIKPLSSDAQSIWARTDSTGTASQWSQQLRITSAGKFEAFVDDGADRTVTGTTTVVPNTWYHVAMTAANGGQLKLFVNGQPEGSPGSIGTMWAGGDRYQLGSSSGDGFGWLHAVVDRVRVYNRALTAADVGLLYAITPTSLAGHWALDETSGTTATDTSQRHADGTLVGGATRTTGRLGGAVSFNGSNGYVSLPNAVNSPAVTVGVWVKLTSLAAQSILVRTSSAGATNAASHQLRLNANGNFEAMMFDGAAKKVVSITKAKIGQWYHLGFTAQANGQLKLYVNGMSEGAPVSVGALWASGDRYWLGSNSSGFGWFSGIADDVQIFDAVFNAAEMSNLADLGGGLSGYWPFDENQGTSAADASGYFNHATISGGAVWGTGHSGAGLRVNGTDASVAIPAPIDPTALTVSLWVKSASTSAQSLWARTSSAGPATDWSHQLRIGSGGTFEAVMKDGGTRTVTGTTAIQANRWYLVTLTAEDSGQLRLYVNGAAEGSAASIGTMWTGGDRYVLGAATGGGSGWLDGMIDEVRLADHALSAAEVSALYTSSPTNVAREATSITASSQYSSQYLPAYVNDGIVGLSGSGEWASNQTNPWIQMNWATAQTINKVVFFDRPNTAGWSSGGTLEFSDGTVLTVSGIPNDGSPGVLAFAPRTVTWAKFTIAGSGPNNGLDELQFFDGAIDSPLNIAREAAVTATSQYSAQYAPINAIDDIVGVSGSGEWASTGQVNPSITLTWQQPRTFNTVVLHDRPDGSNWTQGGTLTFSDGSTWPVSGLPTDGKALTVSFPAKTVTAVTFTLSGSGSAIGLSEIRVFNDPAAQVNLAPIAQLTASTEFNTTTYAKSKAVDGFVGTSAFGEWASTQLNPTLSLTWSQSQTISRVVLYDRPAGNTNANSGTLTFSNGSTVAVTGIPTDGSPLVVDFAPRTVTSITFTTTGGTGSNVGLAEIAVY